MGRHVGEFFCVETPVADRWDHGFLELQAFGCFDAESVGFESGVLKGYGGCRREHGAEVDGHVEDGECGIAACAVADIVVEVAYHHLQVAFEESCAHGDQQQCGKEDVERCVLTHRSRD